MMKNLRNPVGLVLLMIFLFWAGSLSFAQTVRKNDLIIKRDSSKIEALILEIDGLVIKYKKYSDQEGPTFSIGKRDVATIVYGNGEVENFPVEAEVYFDEVPIPGAVPYKNEEKKSNERVNRFRAGAVQSMETQQLRYNYAFYLKKAAKYKTMSIVGTSVGLLMTISGFITVSAAIRDINAAGGYSSTSNDSRIGGGVLLVMGGLGAGVPLTIVGLVKKRSYNKKALMAQEELRRRNEPLSSIKISPAFNAYSKTAGLSLSMTF
jgi:hypothetical protein